MGAAVATTTAGRRRRRTDRRTAVRAQSRRGGDRPFSPPAIRKIVVLTTSYPRDEEDFAGRFVADSVAAVRARGVEVEVVSPGVYRTFGIGRDGGGFVRGLKRRPWFAPLIFMSMLRAVRRAARDAEVVHVHWLAAALVGAWSGKPFVVTLHGSGSAGRFADLELADRRPWLVRRLLRRASIVIGVSPLLVDAAARCGARDVRFIPNGVSIPVGTDPEAEPLEVLYAGRLAPEKGIAELMEATAQMNLVVAGDGPLRHLVPAALGFVRHSELERLYDRAAVVVCSSYREGLPLCVIEAMAHGKPVVATTVGGIPTLVEHGRTGFLVEPGDAVALREAIERLLGDAELRKRFGDAGRAKIASLCSWRRVTDATLGAYIDARVPVATSSQDMVPTEPTSARLAIR
jgi:glycosyltransferase involved in cell wall biosynthesis